MASNACATSDRTCPYDIVCFSHLSWDGVFQRPQHLLCRFARERRVFYFEDHVIDEGPPFLEVRTSPEGVVVARPHRPERLTDAEAVALKRGLVDGFFAAHGIQQYVLWYYSPLAVRFARHLTPLATVYDCMDELSCFAHAAPQLPACEAELLARADLVFAGGQSLYEAKRERHAHVCLFPSSVDTAHFLPARRPLPVPSDMAAILSPRLGYFGVLDERLDLDLLAALADERPDWSLVLIGPVVKISEAALPRRPNIHYLGRKDYAELPSYLAGWDVALLPFAHNAATRYISPTKTLEYLAGGVPTVSTSIRDVVSPYGERGLVRIADTSADFVAAVEASLRADRAAWLAEVDAWLATTSWDRTWETMCSLVDEVVSVHRAAGGATTPRAAARDMQQLEVSMREADARGDSGAQAQLDASRAAAGLISATASAADDTVLDAEIVARDARRMNQCWTPGEAFDYLIVGAGFAGSVLAERLATQLDKRVLLIDRRAHIGGNAYDCLDDAGILVHRYGPHIFHTNSDEVFAYLSQFTAWRPYEHRVLASVRGQLVPFPVNLETLHRLYGVPLDEATAREFLTARAEPRERIRTSEDVVVSQVGRELYELFFRNYTRKQWGLDPSELDATVTARVPVRTSRDDRYFTDRYQAMPREGYTRLFERMLAHPNIHVGLNADYRDVRDAVAYREVIYTGPIDEYFDYRFGPLPYRSLEFRFETVDTPLYQPVAVVNYPNDHAYTRVTEFKRLTGQEHPRSTLVYEYPRAEGDPYYPVPRPENAARYKQYKALADTTPGVHFVGRLATYRYYNMDQVVAQALTLFKKLAAREDDARMPAAHLGSSMPQGLTPTPE
jgi:UDP-galactopyranose mutase